MAVDESNVSPALDFGHKSQVAAVVNNGKQVASVASSATVTAAIVVWSPVFAPLIEAVHVTVSAGVDAPDIATVLYLPAVISPVVSAIVTALS